MYNKRQELILDYIKDNPSIKRENIENYLSMMGETTTKMTITRDLKLLLDNGEIEKSGKAKATTYKSSTKLNPLKEINIETYFAKEQDERLPNKVTFNFDVFNILKDLFTSEEKLELKKINKKYIEKNVNYHLLVYKKNLKE